jgi:hypothetical protein
MSIIFMSIIVRHEYNVAIVYIFLINLKYIVFTLTFSFHFFYVHVDIIRMRYIKGRDPLILAYFDNLDNEFSNKKQILKIEKNLIYIYIYFIYRLIVI